MQCRQTRASLLQTETPFTERDFFRQKFTKDELRALIGSRPISDIFAARSPSVKKLGLDPATMSDDEKLDWMLKEPRLIRRPFLIVDGELVVQPKQKDLETLKA